MALFHSEPGARRRRGRRRPFKLIAAVSGALVLVAAAAFLLARPRDAPRPGGQVIAVVGRHEVTEQDLQAEARAQGLTMRPALRSALLETVVSRLLLADAARAGGLDRRPDYPSDERRMEAQTLADQFIRQAVWTLAAERPSNEILSKELPSGARRRLSFRTLRFAASSDPALPTDSLDRLALALRRNGVTSREAHWEAYADEVPPGLLRAVDAASGAVVIRQDGPNSAAYQLVATISAPPAPRASADETTAAKARAARRQALQDVLARLRRNELVRYREDFQSKTSP